MECREKCLRAYSCMAYKTFHIIGAGSGCVIWFGDLNDLRVQPDAGQELYVHVLSSVLGIRFIYLSLIFHLLLLNIWLLCCITI